MKKTLLATALVAGFAGVAQAESSVQLYGVVDAGVGYTSASYKLDGNQVLKKSTLDARSGVESGNRWGLKGKEDLGNGTYAIFQLESGFDIATGKSAQGGRLFGRKALLGLSGDSWGTFTIGRQGNAADDYMGDYDPFGGGFGQAANTTVFGDATGSKDAGSLKYVSPDLAGLKLSTSLEYLGVSSESGGVKSSAHKHAFSLALAYTTGPFSAAASFSHENQLFAKVKAWNLGLSYDFDAAKVYAMYGQQRGGFYRGAVGAPIETLNKAATIGWDFASGSEDFRSQAWLLGVSAPVGEAGNVMFSYQGGRIENRADSDSRLNRQVYSLGYTQALSKRTDIYSVLSYSKASYDKATLNTTDFAVGLRHKF